MSIITIDGKEYEFTPGQTVYEVSRANGVSIPVLCHQEQLKPVGACRVCVVEVQGARSLIASCAMPAEKGMIVTTNSDRVISARRLTVELLMTQGHHNCITCESSGDCVLQDLAYSLGIETPRFLEPGEYKPLEQANEMIVRDMNKCVLCGLCVRACNEIQVNQVLDYAGRGPTATVGPAFGVPYELSECVFCGECVRLCPVGALFEKQGRFKGRATDLTKVRTTCEYCGVGCQMDLNIKEGKVVKVSTPRWNAPPPNSGSLCIKGRFGYDFLDHPDRLTKPLIRVDGELKEASWDDAIAYVAEKLNSMKLKDGPDAIAGLASARCTNEENYLFQKFLRAVIGTNNVDHCARL
jgi:predicted molibdopterin-dependent oxidoreductase YjgC